MEIINSFEEFRKITMQNIFELIEKSNSSKFEIIGYKFLDIKLLLIFDDCIQVFIYDFKCWIKFKYVVF